MILHLAVAILTVISNNVVVYQALDLVQSLFDEADEGPGEGAKNG